MTEKKTVLEKKTALDEAHAALERDREARMQACATELGELLKRHNCRLDAVPMIVDGGVVAQVQVVAVE